MKRLWVIWLAALLLAACGGDDGNGGGGNGGGNGGDDNGAEQDGGGNGGDETDTEEDTGDTGGGGGEEYPQNAINNFLESCTAQEGATQSECQCAIDQIQQEIPYDEFVEIDTALREGRDPPPGSQEKITEAIRECRE